MELSNETVLGLVSAVMQCSTQAPDDAHWEVGKNYFFRMATYFYTGKLVAVAANELVIEDAAWIAETGRFMEALKTGDFSEVEPYPAGKVILGRGALVDASRFDHDLPREQK